MTNKNTNQLIESKIKEAINNDVLATNSFGNHSKLREKWLRRTLTQVATHKEQEVLERIRNINVEAGNGGLGNFVKEAIIKSLEKDGN